MSEVVLFEFESKPVRSLLIGDEPWFVAADVCAVLGTRNSRDALARLDSDEKGVAITDTLGGPQEMSVINESGLYSLTLTSRKPEAKRFKKWVTSEVLPSIRKTGRYEAQRPVATTSAEMFALVAQQFLENERRMANLESKVEALEKLAPSPSTHSTVMGYASALGISIDSKLANKLGRRCANYCRLHGMAITPIHDDRYGTVNSYPLEVLEAIFSQEAGCIPPIPALTRVVSTCMETAR